MTCKKRSILLCSIPVRKHSSVKPLSLKSSTCVLCLFKSQQRCVRMLNTRVSCAWRPVSWWSGTGAGTSPAWTGTQTSQTFSAFLNIEKEKKEFFRHNLNPSLNVTLWKIWSKFKTGCVSDINTFKWESLTSARDTSTPATWATMTRRAPYTSLSRSGHRC